VGTGFSPRSLPLVTGNRRNREDTMQANPFPSQFTLYTFSPGIARGLKAESGSSARFNGRKIVGNEFSGQAALDCLTGEAATNQNQYTTDETDGNTFTYDAQCSKDPRGTS
jgi:hypothetical protein